MTDCPSDACPLPHAETETVWGSKRRFGAFSDWPMVLACAAMLVQIEHGRLAVVVNEVTHIVSRGVLLAIPKDTSFSFRPLGHEAEGALLAIPAAQDRDWPSGVALLGSTPLVDALLPELLRGPEAGAEGPAAPRSRLMGVLVDQLMRLAPAAWSDIALPKARELLNVAEQVLRHPGDMQDISHWARKARMSRRSFTKRFAEETGLSFAVWRRRVKWQTAVPLLQSGMHCKEVAIQLGFATSSAFIEAFRRDCGLPPLRYMERFRRAERERAPEPSPA